MRVIAGSARRINLVTPAGDDTRPTTDRIKETLFNILQPDLYDARFLDLFAGSGGIGIEALSRGASEAVFVERARKPLECIKENLRRTGLFPAARVIESDVYSAIGRLKGSGRFDIIFMDPPYDSDYIKGVLAALRSTDLADEDTMLIAEADRDMDMSFAAELGYRIDRIKNYKTNMHVFMSISTEGEPNA